MVDSAPRSQPEPRRANATRSPASTATLPVPVTTFVGRTREVAEVHAVLARDDVRLLTLTGPGGAGKTRLALEVARTFAGYAGATWFVSLAAIRDTALVPATIAGVLGIPRISTEHGLISALREQRALLILDNFEQVRDAAGVVSHLLAASDALKVIVTSRTVLHQPGEHVYAVPPLAHPGEDDQPTGDEILAADAVQLIITRVRDRGLDVSLTPETARIFASICRVLDGLPLAIELAASWLRILPPGALLERLDRRLPMLEGGPRDAPARQRTMRATIEWSYALLSPDAQRLLRRLSVFVGGFSADAIGQVTGMDPDSVVMSLFDTLIDHSMVRQLAPSLGGTPDAPRYITFSTIREFGLERLQVTREIDAARARHARWCIDLASTAARERIGLADTRVADRLMAERHNLRDALGWLEANDRTTEALELAATLWPLWLEHGEITEGRRHLDRLLSRCEDGCDPAIRASAQQVLGMLCQAQGDLSAARELSHEALTVFDETGDDRGAGAALTTLGLVSMVQGDDAAATAHLERSLDRFREAGDPRAGAWALRHLSSVAYRRGDIDAYERYANAGLEIVLPMGDPLDIARLRANLALAATIRGHLEDATTRYDEVLALYRQANDRWGESDALHRIGHVAFLRGDDDLAEHHFERSAALLQHIGDPEGTVRVLVGQGWLARRRGDIELATERFVEAQTIARGHHIRRTLAKALLGEGVLALDRGDLAAAAPKMSECLTVMVELGDPLAILTALEWVAHLAGPPTLSQVARLVSACEAQRESTGIPTLASGKPEHKLLARAIRTRLGVAAFNEAVTAGRLLTLKRAVAEARIVIEAAATLDDDAHWASVTPAGPPVDILSPREMEVIRLLVEGHSDQGIAERLSISRRTATTHVGNIFSKLGVSTRAAAAAWAARHGVG